MTAAPLTVIGWDGGPMRPEAVRAVADATVVVGSVRLLSLVPLPAGVRTVSTEPFSAALAALAEHEGPAVVLASGDPGLFGVTRTLRALGYDPLVFPAVSSIALLAARLGEASDDAVIVSAHGRDPRFAVNAARAVAAVYVLTCPEFGPAELGLALAGWSRRLVIGERLGHGDEAVTECTPEEAAGRSWRGPNLVLVVDDSRRDSRRRRLRSNQPAAPPGVFAPHENQFEHRDSMVTRWEVRAAAVARLGPTLGTLVWDVGAGSGSVGVECASLHSAVVAIDSDPAASARITANAAARGVDVRVVDGVAPKVLDGLPDPDAVFVGGGGLEVLLAVARRSPGRVVATYAAIDRVTQARRMLVDAGYAVDGVQLQSSRLSELPDGGLRLAATNPVFLLACSLESRP